MMTPDELKQTAYEAVWSITENSALNNLVKLNERAWGEPIIAYSNGADPLFASYKTLIGGFYWTPAEAMKLEYPNDDFDGKNLTVISWLLPQTGNTIADQKLEKELPADRWILSRHYGEIFNEKLRAGVRDIFKSKGVKACAPAILKEFAYQHSDTAGICSNWSERHTAYAAGLGTFGLSDGFITEKGKAIRIGSVIVDAYTPPDARKYSNHLENCLYHSSGKCGACIRRCPADAISKAGHDKQKCFDYIRGVIMPHASKLVGTAVTPCGLCQGKVPCQSGNPHKNTNATEI
jgi:ferredoxin